MKKFIDEMSKLGLEYGDAPHVWYTGEYPVQYIFYKTLRVFQNMEELKICLELHYINEKRQKEIKKFYDNFNPNDFVSCRGCVKGACEKRLISKNEDSAAAKCVRYLPATDEYLDVVVKIMKIAHPNIINKNKKGQIKPKKDGTIRII
jgi:hypothetical protein